MTHHIPTRFRLTATALVAALGVAATPAVVVTSLANPPAAMAKKKKKSCRGGDPDRVYKHGKIERMSSRNEDGSTDHYGRMCNNGRWGDWAKTGTTYPGNSDGSEGGPSV